MPRHAAFLHPREVEVLLAPPLAQRAADYAGVPAKVRRRTLQPLLPEKVMHIRLLDLRRRTLHPVPAAPVLAAFRERQQAQT